MGMISGVFPENGSRRYCLMLLLLFQPALMATGDRVIASAHNGLNAYLLSSNIVKYLRPLAIGGKGLLADKTAYLTDNITEKSSLGQNPWTNVAPVSNRTEQDQTGQSKDTILGILIRKVQ